MNRRGFSTRILCFECGHAERCADCDVGLVYHAADGALHCHYCEHRRPPPERCAGCGAPDTALLGLGTERVEEEVRALFGRARIARLDRDTAARRGTTESVLRRLRDGQLDVLIGTQMVAKGHDFPGVRLVGVIAADVGLHLPDFRAAERTFQLLTQVAGRAGRDTAPGRVIVQTFVPDHYAVRPVRDHDYEAFYAQEIAHRAALGFPPFGHLANVVVSAERESEAVAGAAQLAAAIASFAQRASRRAKTSRRGGVRAARTGSRAAAAAARPPPPAAPDQGRARRGAHRRARGARRGRAAARGRVGGGRRASLEHALSSGYS